MKPDECGWCGMLPMSHCEGCGSCPDTACDCPDLDDFADEEDSSDG